MSPLPASNFWLFIDRLDSASSRAGNLATAIGCGGHLVTALACIAVAIGCAMEYRRASECVRPAMVWGGAAMMALGIGQLTDAIDVGHGYGVSSVLWIWAVALSVASASWHVCRWLPVWLDTRRDLVSAQVAASRDVLTALHNRQGFNRALDASLDAARSGKATATLALFDLDGFKQANDLYGHPVGDRILQEVGAILQSYSRKSDCMARLGGDEFAALWSNCTATEARALTESIRRDIARIHVEGVPSSVRPVTSSIGVAELDPKLSAEGNYELVDRFLYESKRLGKNQVCWFSLQQASAAPRAMSAASATKVMTGAAKQAATREVA